MYYLIVAEYYCLFFKNTTEIFSGNLGDMLKFGIKNLSMFNAQSNLFFNEKPFTHDCDYLITNERASYVLKNDRLTLYFTQIADNWVNKIVTFKNGEPIKQGERFGMIRMGSQVDIFVPKLPKMKILVRERQHVKAGLTPLIELQNNN